MLDAVFEWRKSSASSRIYGFPLQLVACPRKGTELGDKDAEGRLSPEYGQEKPYLLLSHGLRLKLSIRSVKVCYLFGTKDVCYQTMTNPRAEVR